eukprot:TRINITY_DN1599_c0_g1_i13.p1 TRINITY_DN1599_c0_g1~~TRINITY_DN1599_c0_g1_i13.p1  ORF type:complete len:243 (+),score=30.75 TRINITY_DN1599_c0_g1_i13:111-839(+)
MVFTFISRTEAVVSTQSTGEVTKMVEAFKDSTHMKKIQNFIDSDKGTTTSEKKKSHFPMLHPYDTSMGTQLFYLIQRVFLSWLRNPLNFFGRLLVFTQLGLFMGLLYLKIHFTQESLQDRISALAFCSIFLMFMPMCAIEIFLEDRDIFLRERMNGYYTVLPYVLANTIVSNMFIALCCCVFSGIVYVLIGFNPSISAFGYFALNLIVTLWCSEGVKACISTLVSSPVIGIAIICCFLGYLY